MPLTKQAARQGERESLRDDAVEDAAVQDAAAQDDTVEDRGRDAGQDGGRESGQPISRKAALAAAFQAVGARYGEAGQAPATAGERGAEPRPDGKEAAERSLNPDELLQSSGSGREHDIFGALGQDDDPLLLAMAELMRQQGVAVSPAALAAGLPMENGRMTPALCLRAAESAGMKARVLKRPKIEAISQIVLPCILLLKNGEACLLYRQKPGGKVEIGTPESGGGTHLVDVAALQECYTGYALFAKPELRFDARAEDIRLSEPRSWFWGTLRQFWGVYTHVGLASLLINCFAIASPLFIMNVYDRVVPNQAMETLWVLAIGVATVFAFEFLLRNLRSYFVDTAGKSADTIIASRLFQQVLGMRMANKPPSTGVLANHLREFESLREFFTSGTVVALVDLPFIFLFLWVIWFVGGPIAIVPATAVPLVIIVGLLLQLPMRRTVEKTYRENAQKHALLVEAIDGLESLKARSAESVVQGNWERVVDATARSSAKARLISNLSTSFAQVAVQACTIAVVVYGVHLIIEGELTMGALIASTMLTGRALAPLGQVAGMLTRLQQSRVALKSLHNLMQSPVERTQDRHFLSRPRLSGEIEFRRVAFTYPEQKGRALEDLSFSVQPGEKVALIGRIGSGKSTISRLLMGLYEAEDGAILLDGVDIRQLDPADIRRNIGYVSQDDRLFFGTVRENICFGRPQASDEEILRAARLSGVHDFISTHPLGYDLPVGERGGALSGGQRQSLSIARALLTDPSILIMDEPTAHMDNASEAAFRDRLGQILANKTLLLATHRSSMLALVERIVVVERGRVVADGPRDEVLRALREGKLRVRAQAAAPGAAGESGAKAAQ